MVGEAIVNGREVSTVSVYNAGSATETVLLKLYDDSTTVEGIVGVLTVPSGTCVAHTSPIYMEDADILRYQCRHGEEVFVTTDWKDPKDAWKK
jgi:glutaredoxin 2